MPGLAAINIGTCTGEGVPVPMNVHATTACAQPACPPANLGCALKPLAAMVATCQWPETPLIHKVAASAVKTVKIQGSIPIVDQDILINHISDTTQQVINLFPTPKAGCTTPKPAACNGSFLTVEDQFEGPGRGHLRRVTATSTTVFVEGRRLACVGDPLGPPCLAVISTGAATVMVGK